MEKLINIKKNIDKSLIGILGILLCVMLALVFWQVFSRYIIRIPATFTEELVRFTLIWLGLLSGALAFGMHKHLSLTLVFDLFSTKMRFFIKIIVILFLIFLAFSLFIYGGIKMVLVAWHQTSAVLSIPMGYIYIILPLTGILILFYQLYDLIMLIYYKGEQL